MTAQLNQQPPSPISLRADVPPALNEIILMAMAKEPRIVSRAPRRFATH